MTDKDDTKQKDESENNLYRVLLIEDTFCTILAYLSTLEMVSSVAGLCKWHKEFFETPKALNIAKAHLKHEFQNNPESIYQLLDFTKDSSDNNNQSKCDSKDGKGKGKEKEKAKSKKEEKKSMIFSSKAWEYIKICYGGKLLDNNDIKTFTERLYMLGMAYFSHCRLYCDALQYIIKKFEKLNKFKLLNQFALKCIENVNDKIPAICYSVSGSIKMINSGNTKLSLFDELENEMNDNCNNDNDSKKEKTISVTCIKKGGGSIVTLKGYSLANPFGPTQVQHNEGTYQHTPIKIESFICCDSIDFFEVWQKTNVVKYGTDLGIVETLLKLLFEYDSGNKGELRDDLGPLKALFAQALEAQTTYKVRFINDQSIIDDIIAPIFVSVGNNWEPEYSSDRPRFRMPYSSVLSCGDVYESMYGFNDGNPNNLMRLMRLLFDYIKLEINCKLFINDLTKFINSSDFHKYNFNTILRLNITMILNKLKNINYKSIDKAFGNILSKYSNERTGILNNRDIYRFMIKEFECDDNRNDYNNNNRMRMPFGGGLMGFPPMGAMFTGKSDVSKHEIKNYLNRIFSFRKEYEIAKGKRKNTENDNQKRKSNSYDLISESENECTDDETDDDDNEDDDDNDNDNDNDNEDSENDNSENDENVGDSDEDDTDDETGETETEEDDSDDDDSEEEEDGDEQGSESQYEDDEYQDDCQDDNQHNTHDNDESQSENNQENDENDCQNDYSNVDLDVVN